MARESTRRIAILAPMPSELRPLRRPLGLLPAREPQAGLFRGGRGDVVVAAALTGVGMRRAAEAAARILEAVAPEHLVVVGIAGGIGSRIAVGDLVVPDRVVDLDAGTTHRPAPFGRVPRRGGLATSARLPTSPEVVARLAREGFVAIDMETAAIAAVCEARGCPWSVFRAISDRADDGSTDAAILDLLDPDGRPRPLAAMRLVLGRPRRIPQLVRLARGAHLAARVAARAALDAIADDGAGPARGGR